MPLVLELLVKAAVMQKMYCEVHYLCMGIHIIAVPFVQFVEFLFRRFDHNVLRIYTLLFDYEL